MSLTISLSGRKHSGKSVLSEICSQNGFQVLRFADSLKNLTCEILKCDRVTLENIKETTISLYFQDDLIELLSKKLDVGIEILKPKFENIEFTSPRHILQYLGTDIIREFNPNWHINELRKRIDFTKNICIDDARFPNELEFIKKELKGISWYIIRPNNFNISNHESEISVKWNNFDEIIINNISLKLLQKKWINYLDFLLNPNFTGVKKPKNFEDKKELREYLKYNLLDKTTEELASILECSRDKIVWWCNKLMLQIDRSVFNYNVEAFLYPTQLSAYCGGLLTSDGCIKISKNKQNAVISFASNDIYMIQQLKKLYESKRKAVNILRKNINHKNGFELDCANYLILENLKHWNIKPQKSMKEEIPDIIKNNIEFMKQWIVGLIDGDGYIMIPSKRKTITISILASKEVIEYINQISPIKGILRQHKKHLPLFQLNFHNYTAVDFYNWLSPVYKLERKWNKIQQFIDFNTKRRKY